MSVWDVLGIEPTNDEKIIKNAYRGKLVFVNPEDDVEGFKKLRGAYEEALILSKQQNEEKNDNQYENSGITEKINEIYSCFEDRINEQKWIDLFNSDCFVSLVTGEDALSQLILYLESHFFLPHKIWKCINETFDIENRKKELGEKFPQEFIDYIISNSKYKDVLNYYLLNGNEKEYDSFIDGYYRLDSAIRNGEPAAREMLEDLASMNVFHPYLAIEEMKIVFNELQINEFVFDEDLDEEKKEKLLDVMEKLQTECDDYPEEISLLIACGNIALITGNVEAAEEYFAEAKNIDAEDFNLKTKYAQLAYYKGDYKKARNDYMDLLKVNHYDSRVRLGMIRSNQKIIQEINSIIQRIESGEEYVFEEDCEFQSVDDLRLELGWSYYQCYMFDNALENLEKFLPSEEKKFEYFNVKGRVYLCLNKYDEAITCFKIWKEAIERLDKNDKTEKANEKRKRYEYVNFLIADCYIRMKKYNEALPYLNVSLSKEHDEMVLSYEANCELWYGLKEYEKCILACEELLQKDDKNYMGYYYMAKAFYKMDYIKETLLYCEKAIAIFPYTVEPYVIEIKLYLKYEQIEGAQAVVDRYNAFEIKSDTMDYYQALIMIESDKEDDAIKLLKSICERYNEESSDLAEDIRIEDVYVKIGEIYDYKDDFDNAEKYLKEAININPEHKSANGRLGIVYRQQERYTEALEKLSMQIMIKPGLVYYLNRGIIHRFFENYKSAISDFKNALEIDPSNSYCYSRIGMIYEYHRNFKEALESYDNAIKYADDSEKEFVKDVLLLKARVYQCTKEFEKSEQVYACYIENYGVNINVCMEYAKLLYRSAKVNEAIEVLTKFMETTKNVKEKQDCLVYLCDIYGKEGLLSRANECYMLGINNNPDDYEIIAKMAEILNENDIIENVIKLYQNAIELDKDNKENYYIEIIHVLSKQKKYNKKLWELCIKLANELIKNNNPKETVKFVKLRRLLKDYETAKETALDILNQKRCLGCHYSMCHKALFELGLICEKEKKYKEALDYFEKALDVCGHNALYEKKIKELKDK